MNIRIFPPEELVEATVELPISKSVAARAMIINSLTSPAGEFKLPDDRPLPTDITTLYNALQALRNADKSSSDPLMINVGGSGSAMRFLTAFLSVQEGLHTVIDGDERSHQRPIGTLVESLRWCGADITFIGEEGFPPLEIKGRKLRGGDIAIPSSVSSQYVSAVMMVAPFMTGGLHITLQGEQVSSPYVKLTTGMMEKAGVAVDYEGAEVTIPESTYKPVDWQMESDWSAASYWYEIESLSSGFITLPGLDTASLQPDRAAADIFSNLGVATNPDDTEEGEVVIAASPELSPRLVIDLSDNPDLVPPLAVTCAMAGIPFSFTGISHLRVKESDRIEALHNELLKVGVSISTEPAGTMTWDGHRLPISQLPEFDTYNDHRIAMALAPVALYIPGIIIKDTDVVNKSYPTFWQDLSDAGFKFQNPDEPAEESQENEQE